MHRSAFALVNGSPVDHLSASTPAEWWAWIWTHIAPYLPLAWQIVTVLLALAATVISWRLVRRGMRALIARAKANSFEDNLTIVAAGIATGVSATGMWKFADEILHLWWPLRIILFAFIEVAIVTSAVRAKRSMREHFKAGVDGIAVWVLACLTAVLSSLDAASFGEAVFRLAAPLVAAWLWERGMRLERHRLRGTTGINWRLTPERIAVRLGLAEASDRTAGEVDAHRRLTRVALAAKRAKALREAGASERKLRAAFAKLDKAMDAAVELAGLAVDESRQKALLDQIDALNSTEALAKRQKIARWANPVDEEARAKADAAMDELARLNARQATRRALDKTALALMSLTPDVTPELINSGVNGKVNNQVNGSAPQTPRNGSGLTSELTPDVTVERVNDRLNFDVNDAAIYDLQRMLSADPYVTPQLTPELTPGDVNSEVNDDIKSASKTQVMKEFWDAEVAEDRYPSVTELARHAGADDSLASRKRREWVAALPWRQRRKANARRTQGTA